MILYHGTSESAARAILEGGGIRPRGSRAGNWANAPSRADCVYLTAAYAPYFASSAAKTPLERWAILEIDVGRLDQELLVPDEDFLEEATRKKDCGGRDITDRKRLARTGRFRNRILEYQHHWRDSLSWLGNCAYFGGPVPGEVIERVSFFQPQTNPDFAGLAMDPTISIVNYQMFGWFYRNLTRWFFLDASLTPEDLTKLSRHSFDSADQKIRELIEEERASVEKAMRLQRGLEVFAVA